MPRVPVLHGKNTRSHACFPVCPQITALKNLNLNIRRAKISPKNESSFFITDADTSEKIVRSARLEEIRMTVLNSLVATFPVSAVVGHRSSRSMPCKQAQHSHHGGLLCTYSHLLTKLYPPFAGDCWVPEQRQKH